MCGVNRKTDNANKSSSIEEVSLFQPNKESTGFEIDEFFTFLTFNISQNGKFCTNVEGRQGRLQIAGLNLLDRPDEL